ncbi:DUF5977 domain-containing protein [Terrimonas sp. NA20]|uniref:DUF5977 domain-containing protein n=1 Tax=Terrimonas ginsenosidimutans TaxID=2908004 RepID=A0ABS9KM79_9BACT|nr:DUF5977 domain-containing protein [Terrimonas ginsenosidimutans]MCG2613432.1 DUF5977 domain-containing protein [Terrimonas ginsenosidimutans]
MIRKIGLIFIAWIACVKFSHGQSDFILSPTQLQSVIPASPNAAALGKFGVLPVGKYTGLPSIDVPLYEVVSGKLRVPVSLSYHAGGVKVEELASWVGMGWSLNAGGAITRQTRGRPDESINGFLSRHADIRRFIANEMSPTERTAYMEDVTKGNVDSEPDLFMYNFPGGSGTAFYDTLGAVHTMPVSRLSISGSDGSWIIVDLDGTRYYFTAAETSQTTPLATDDANVDGYFNSAISSVFLTKIVAANAVDSIVFEYEQTNYSFNNIASQTKFVYLQGNCTTSPVTNVSTSTTLTGQRLKKITFKGGELVFNAQSNARQDLPNDHALSNIEVKRGDGSVVREIRLFHNYRVSPGAPGTYNTSYSDYYRLFLDSVRTETPANVAGQTHRFAYNTTELPKRNSFNQDFWGYSNGANNPAFLYPTILYTNPLTSVTMPVQGADRNTNAQASQSGMLTSIQYPTGGKTFFEYENNKVSSGESFTNSTEYKYLMIGSQPNQRFYTGSFTLPAATMVQVTVTPENCGGGVQTEFCPVVNITGPNGSYAIPVSSTIALPAGAYTVTADLNGVVEQSILDNFSLQIRWSEVVQVNSKYQFVVGGHRIKSIHDEDYPGHIINHRRFEYLLPDSSSSGTVLSLPKFESNFFQVSSISIGVVNTCEFYTISSASNYPLLATKGSNVGYSLVREYLGENGEGGMTESSFTSPASYGDHNYTAFPFAPSVNYEWRRGLPLLEKKMRKAGSVFEPVEEQRNTYIEIESTLRNAIKIGTKNVYNPGIQYESQQYNVAAGIMLLDSSITKVYNSQGSGSIQRFVNYGYSAATLQVSNVRTIDSKGQELIRKTKYAGDYNAYAGVEPAAKAIQQLKDLYILAVPVEQKVIAYDGSVYSVLDGSLDKFKTTMPVPDTTFRLKASSSNADTSMSYIDAGGFKKSALYDPRVSFTRYAADHKILEMNEVNNIPHSYIWGYGGRYPIAEIKNAKHSDIFCDVFEGAGGWDGPIIFDNTKSHTGKGSGRIDGQTGTSALSAVSTNNINISLTGPTVFMYSGWVFSDAPVTKIYLGMKRVGEVAFYTYMDAVETSVTGKWVYLEKKITVPADVVTMFLWIDNKNNFTTQKVWFDDIRLHPSTALMQTYTYDPEIGMTSQTDVNNRSVFYEYDALGRLTVVRDQDKNVVKKICYNLAGQQEDCGIFIYQSAVTSASFTRNNCGSGGTPGSVTYTIPAGAYTSTISQLDADQKAVSARNAGGQAYANANATCTWYNTARSNGFTRNNCGAGGTGGTITYSVAPNTYSSTISQADADQQAINQVNANGQNYANANASCSWYNQAQSNSFTRNNCAPGGTGGTVTYTIAANTYSSNTSEADANQQAVNAVNAGGQAYANANATCTWYNNAQSNNFTRNNCGVGGTGGTVTYTVAANTYSSTVSQSDANQQATNAVNAGGQAYANANATCTWSNQYREQLFFRSDCPPGYDAGWWMYIVSAGTFTSTTSQLHADQLAQNDINANGQSVANANATCTAAGCNTGNCWGEDRKCIGGVCEVGYKVVTGSVWNEYMQMWECTYHYEFSDFTWSQDYVEYSDWMCDLS